MKKLTSMLLVSMLVSLFIGVTVFPTIAAERPKVGLVLFGEDVFFRTVELGARAAAQDLGAQLYVANSGYSVDKERQILSQYLSMGIQALVISPMSRTASIPALKEYVSAKVPVICYNTTVDDPSIPRTFVGTENKELGIGTGTSAVKYIPKKFGKHIKLAVLCCFKYPVCHERLAGFLETLDKAGITYDILVKLDQETADSAMTATQNLLTGYPDVQVIYTCNEGATVGAVRAVKLSGRKDVKVFGTDLSIQTAELLLSPDGILQAVTGQKPYDIGYTAVKAVLDALQGKSIPERMVVPVLPLSRDDSISTVVAFIESQEETQK